MSNADFITIVHVLHIQFGRYHRFRNEGLTVADGAMSPCPCTASLPRDQPRRDPAFEVKRCADRSDNETSCDVRHVPTTISRSLSRPIDTLGLRVVRTPQPDVIASGGRPVATR